MATIDNTLRMKDSVGSVLRNIITSVDMTISSMERLSTASDNVNMSGDFISVKQQIGLTRNELNMLDDDIRKASNEQDNFNNKIRDGTGAANNLKTIFASIGGIMAAKKVVSASDEWAQSTARLQLIVDDEGSVEALQKRIFASAQDARVLYNDMASSVAKLGLLAGDSFSNTDEIVKFTETFSKMGTISGASASEISNAMYQLNQAMASGRLQGDEYRSIIENAPMLAQSIADYMGIGRDELKELASQGKITSDVIKNAMFSVADEVDEKFKKMPMTWGQVWNKVINKVLMLSQPLLDFINLLANNWSLLEPIMLGILFLLGLYVVGLGTVTIWNGITALSESIKAAKMELANKKTLAAVAAMKTATGAQIGYNAALLACPLTWVILIIVAIIAVIYVAVAAINKVTGSTISATGLITGALFTAGAFIGNLFVILINFIVDAFVLLWNSIAAFVNFFGNVFTDPVGAIARLFFDLVDTILSLLQTLASAIDTIFGSNLSGAVQGWRDDLSGWVDDTFGKENEIMVKLKTQDMHLDRFEYGKAFESGYKFGEGIEDKLSNVFSGINLDDLLDGLGDTEFDVNVKDDVNLADESLKFLLDEVTQKYINNINLQAPAPQVTVNQYVNSAADLDLDELAEKTKEKIGTEIVEYAMSSTDIRRDG